MRDSFFVYTHWFSLVTSVTAFALNFCLLPVILWKSGRKIGGYKIFLFLNTFLATIYSGCHALMMPAFHVDDGEYIVFATSNILPIKWDIIIMISFASVLNLIVLVLSLSFVFRLSAVKNVPKKEWFYQPKRVFAIVLFISILSIYYIVISIFALEPRKQHAEQLAKSFNPKTGFKLNEIGYIGGYVYEPETGKMDKVLGYGMVSVALLAMSGTTIMGTCTFFIIKEFRANMSLIGKSKIKNELQKRLFLLLLMQAALPFTFTLTPPMIVFIIALFGMSPGTLPHHLGAVMSVSALFEPILIVYFIQDYKEAILSLFGKGSQTGVTTASSQTTRAK